MEIATIQGEKREPGSRHANQRLRRRDLVPAVIYGHNEPPEMVALSLPETRQALEHTAHVINLRIGAQERQYLIKDVQYDHLQQLPIHMDLLRVDPNERVEVKIGVILRGTPAGAAEGGTLVHVLTDLTVECLLLKIPEAIRVKVDHLALNEALHVKDLELPADVKALHKPDDIVAIVRPPRGTEGEVVAEGAVATEAEPEVIGKGPKEEAAGEGGE